MKLRKSTMRVLPEGDARAPKGKGDSGGLRARSLDLSLAIRVLVDRNGAALRTPERSPIKK